ncbi:MAG: hypothetical protein HXY28_11035 [Hydrogenophilaceae bacterium]|jgi:hypothetical protein|nr:hypothetical protein [Hydrogenophilaceae bacterium]
MTSARYWTYVFATAGAILAEMWLTHALKISGRAEVALMIAALAASVYAATPRAAWGEAKRIWGVAAVAFGALMAASFIGALAGAGMAPSAMLANPGAHGAFATLGVAMIVAAGAYFWLFWLGYSFIVRRRAAASH